MQQMIIRLVRRAFLMALVFAAPTIALDAVRLSGVAAAQSTLDSFDRGLLWRVEKSGAAPSYVFGTIHLADPRVTTLPDAVKQRLDAAKSFTMEVALDASGLMSLATRMVFTDGRDLPGVAGEELYRKVAPLMADHGVPQELARLFKPWAAMLMLVMPLQQSEDALDFVLHRIASAQGKPLYFLETVDDQVAALEGMSEADQVAMLRHAVETRRELPAVTNQLVDAYLQRDLGLMWRINQAGVQDRPGLKSLNAAFTRRLLFDRNARMVERMQPQLRQGNAFIAVGALHLYGDKGILGLLQRAGYRVSRVY